MPVRAVQSRHQRYWPRSGTCRTTAQGDLRTRGVLEYSSVDVRCERIYDREYTDLAYSDEADVLLDTRGKENESLVSKNALVSGKLSIYSSLGSIAQLTDETSATT